MNVAFEAIATYIDSVVAARNQCSRSEDRLEYTKRLAAAAEMCAAAQRRNLSQVVALVESEQRNFGWSYLSGDAGASAERAFQELAESIRSLAGG